MEGFGAISGLLPFVLIFVLFFVLIIRPQQSRDKKHKAMLADIDKGDIVVTSGGLHGRVETTADDGAVLKVSIAEGVRVRVARGTISTVTTPSNAPRAKTSDATPANDSGEQASGGIIGKFFGKK